MIYSMGNSDGLGDKVKKIPWTSLLKLPSNQQIHNEDIFCVYHKFEDEGLGMLEDSSHPGKIDKSNSVIYSDGTIYTPEDIMNYALERRGGFSSDNPLDIKMHKISMYYAGFEEFFLSIK